MDPMEVLKPADGLKKFGERGRHGRKLELVESKERRGSLTFRLAAFFPAGWIRAS